MIAFLVCRGGGTRTHDLVVPNDARYRAALHPVKKLYLIWNGKFLLRNYIFFGKLKTL
jgi:hypothetical protein